MDPLSGLNSEQLHILPWAVAGVFALGAGLLRRNKFHWTAFYSVLLFAAINVGVGFYILKHFRESRWSTGAQPPLIAPSLSETPIVGQYMGSLDTALNGLVGGMNDFRAFQQVLPVATDFFAASGWALLIAFPLAIIAAVISFILARRRTALFDKYRVTVDQLKDELVQVKQQIASLTSTELDLSSAQER
ncbi:hypothetical protein [Arthrobacter sp. TWP1-1]|uniref:hypothetical protein n=1 Tax=Arthrobacter sp. TWP1-1 TaxID=2804568 RepID=UPI003CFA5A01